MSESDWAQRLPAPDSTVVRRIAGYLPQVGDRMDQALRVRDGEIGVTNVDIVLQLAGDLVVQAQAFYEQAIRAGLAAGKTPIEVSHQMGAYAAGTIPPGREPQEAELKRLLDLNKRLHSVARASWDEEQNALASASAGTGDG